MKVEEVVNEKCWVFNLHSLTKYDKKHSVISLHIFFSIL